MEYRFSGQGRSYTLDLEGDREKGFRVRIEDRTLEVRPFHLSENRLVLEVDGRKETFYLAESRDRIFLFHKGRQYALQRSDGSEEFGGEEHGFHGGDGIIETPMPGRVVKILVAEGDMVEPGQPVFIIESMKMENEVTAMGAGKVKKVLAAEGDSLNHGDPVVELFPPDEGGKD